MDLKELKKDYNIALKREGIEEQLFLTGIMIPQAVKAYLSRIENATFPKRLEIKKYIDWMCNRVKDISFDVGIVYDKMESELVYQTLKQIEISSKKNNELQKRTITQLEINGEWLKRIARWNRHSLDDKKSKWIEVGNYRHIRNIEVAEVLMRKEGDKMLGTLLLWDGEEIKTTIEIRKLYKIIGI